MCLTEESLLCLTGETKADIIYEKSNISMCACWRSISRRVEVELDAGGVCTVAKWVSWCSPSASPLLIQPGKSIRFHCSSFLFFHPHMLWVFFPKETHGLWQGWHLPCAEGTATGAWEGKGLLGGLICLYRTDYHGQSCRNGEIIEGNLLCPSHRILKR